MFTLQDDDSFLDDGSSLAEAVFLADATLPYYQVGQRVSCLLYTSDAADE